MVIDFHTHCFPERIAQSAMEKLSFASGGLLPNGDGTLPSLRKAMRAGGTDRFVVLHIATNARQQRKVNDFAVSINGGEVISFGSVFPGAPDATEELERIAAAGLVGVKLHPDQQGFFADDEKMKPLYRKISSLGLIVTFHAGRDLGCRAPYRGTPERLRRALSWLDVPVIAAHWGGAYMSQEVIRKLCGLPVYFDLSFGYGVIPRYDALKIVEKHGTEKLLFGTDFPWHTPEEERRTLETLGLSEAEKRAIYGENAERILKWRT